MEDLRDVKPSYTGEGQACRVHRFRPSALRRWPASPDYFIHPPQLDSSLIRPLPLIQAPTKYFLCAIVNLFERSNYLILRMSTAWRVMVCVAMISTFLPEFSTYNFKVNEFNIDPKLIKNEIEAVVPYVTDEQYIHHIHSMVNAYSNRDDTGGRFVIETNSLINTKYRTWKRNVDLINSLLALPKGMNEAGR